MNKFLIPLALVLLAGVDCHAAPTDAATRERVYSMIREQVANGPEAFVLKDIPQEHAAAYEQRARIAVNGQEPGRPELLDCEQLVPFQIEGYQLSGAILVGRCSGHLQSVLSAADRARVNLEPFLHGKQVPAEWAGMLGLQHTQPEAGKHWLYFPVLLIGHGAVVLPTSALVTDAGLYVVQLQPARFCDSERTSVYCTSTADVLRKITLRLPAAPGELRRAGAPVAPPPA